MALTPSTIQANKSTSKRRKRVGRGNASGKGNYSARGLKGQRSRSGGKGGLRQRSFKAQLQKVPKVRGFKSIKIKPETVTLSAVAKVAKEDTEVTPRLLKEKGVVSNISRGVKIVATGEIKKKLTIKGCLASKKALEMIEKAGGKLIF